MGYVMTQVHGWCCRLGCVVNRVPKGGCYYGTVMSLRSQSTDIGAVLGRSALQRLGQVGKGGIVI